MRPQLAKRAKPFPAQRQLAFHQYRQFVEAVGHIVVYWGLIERQFDNWTMVAFHRCGGDTVAKNVMPRMFKQKRRFLKKCFRELASLQPYRVPATEMLDEARTISNLRNDLVHGNIRRLKSDHGIYRFDILDAKDDYHTARTAEFNLLEFPALEKRMANLAKRARQMSNALIELPIVESAAVG